MKKSYRNLTGIALNAALCLFIALPAGAQQRGDNGGRPSRSAPAPAAAPAAAPAPSRPAPAPRVQMAPPQHNNTNIAPQQRGGNVNVAPQQHGNNFNRGQQRGGTQPQRNNNATQQQYNVTQQRGVNGGRPTINYAPQQRGGSVNGNRPGYNYPGRNGNRPYRSYPGLGYGRNHITARPNGIYYNNRGYYRSYYAPRLGFSIGVLPFGYYPFYYGPSQYFYSDGLYYQQENNQYTVVEPPVGAEINTLPEKAQSITINGIQYYESNGVYYQPITKDDGTVAYQIAGKDGELNTDQGNAADEAPPQIGDLVDTLPPNSRTIKINGQKYYVSEDGYYYQDAKDGDNKVYKIVGTPSDEPGN